MMMENEIIDGLKRIISKDRILSSDLWREIYARDASYFDIKPMCVVRPRNENEIRQLLAFASARNIGVTFRAAGTSLSGQTLGSGIICELRTGFRNAEVRDNGRKIWFEPGLTANQINNILKPHHHHIGPDPASSSAAMMGGILSNNSSGMQAGVEHNSYHTLVSMKFMLANGNCYDTSKPEDYKRFHRDEKDLCQGLMNIRERIVSDDTIRNKIALKYKIKNVTGYAMNSFLDYEDPLDIFVHLMIGSEGTLGYIVSAELETLPLLSTYSSAMLYFPTVTKAAACAARLGESGAQAVEMMDYASLLSSQGLRSDMPRGTTALLVDYGADSPEEMEDLVSSLHPMMNSLPGIIHFDDFTHTVAAREKLWRIRDGVFPCVAGIREPGATVILEDVAAPIEYLDTLVEGVQRLFDRHGYDGAIFGHARAGNIHPLVTSKMDTQRSVDNFKRFMEGFVDHVINLNGSLKGEHGTGRAIAPFVKKEWGEDIYAMMCEIKKLADPANILNPGVMINHDPDSYIRPMKSMDIFGRQLGYDDADKCIECGYCEHVCPSRDITLTPRQRLQARRIIARTGSEKLEKEYRYIGNHTCCADGSCEMPCPMNINTGTVTDAVRVISNASVFDKALSASAGHYGIVEDTIRGVLRAAVATEKVISPYPLIWAADFMHRIYNQSLHWSRHFPAPPRIRWDEGEDHPDFIYFPSCVTRIFGGSTLGKDDMTTVMMRIGRRAGLRMSLPRDFHGLCCSQIWEHKGDPEGQRTVAREIVDGFYRLSREGRIPVVCDTTSCTHTLLSLAHKGDILDDEHLQKYNSLKILDITQWLADIVMPGLKVTKPKGRILLHPTCASRITGLDKKFIEVANKCACRVDIPDNAHCCGAAGDRGFIFPEVAKAATAPEKRETEDKNYDGYYSLARTCEISMTDTIGRPYESIVYLVDETTSSLNAG